MTFQTTALIKLLVSHGPVIWGNRPNNEVFLRRSEEDDANANMLRNVNSLAKALILLLFQPSLKKGRQSQNPRIAHHEMTQNKLNVV